MHVYDHLNSQWLEVVCDSVCSVKQMVHLNIHWMVCSGSSVTDYVAALRRKTQQLGLKVRIQHSCHIMHSCYQSDCGVVAAFQLSILVQAVRLRCLLRARVIAHVCCVSLK
jgi:hypothetical protein